MTHALATDGEPSIGTAEFSNELRFHQRGAESARRRNLGIRGDIVDNRGGPPDETVDIHTVRRRMSYQAQAIRPASEQGCRTIEVAALHVNDANGELGQALPQRSLGVRTTFPRGLEHLVRVERQVPVQQILGVGERFRRWQLEIVRDPRNSGTAGRQKSAHGITRSGVARPTDLVAIALGHVPIILAMAFRQPT
jgi:hypothetical protein